MATKKKRTGKSKAHTIQGLDQKVIETFGKIRGIEYPTAEKVLWMTRVLHGISVSGISRDFALIGGSAIVFLYRDMYRFSTDLDLDFIGNKDLGKAGRREIMERLRSDGKVFEQIAKDLGLRLKRLDQKDERFVQYELLYDSFYTTRGAVELDISYRYCHSVLGPINRLWPITLENVVPKFAVQSLGQEELYANKILAMIEAEERLDFPGHIGLMFKRKIRHLYDVELLADDILSGKSNINIKRLHDLVVLFGMTRIQKFEYFRGNAIGAYKKQDIANELRSVVPHGVRIPTVDEMKWKVRKFFDLLVFNWSNREHRFIEDFRAGNFRPEDLFRKGKIARGLKGMEYYKEILGKVRSIH